MISIHSTRNHISPLRNLTPESLSRILDEFASGFFLNAARTFDAIEQRDDVLKGVAAKRKKSTARLPWEVTATADTDEAYAQAELITQLLHNLSVRQANNHTIHGGLSLLIEQMMDAVGKRYAVHEFLFDDNSATLQFVPLWSFQLKDGSLKFIDKEAKAHELDPARWMISIGDGLMEASAIAYLYKHLPMRDWLLYCERNGMPGIKGITDAAVGSPEWEAAKDAVENFGAEFTALLSSGASIEAIDLSAKGNLPYAELVERMDKALAALWRGSDMSTLSSSNSGASLQGNESAIIEQHDAAMISDTLNNQLLRAFVTHRFGEGTPLLARFKLKPSAAFDREINALKTLHSLGLPIPANIAYSRLGVPQPENE